MSILQQQVVDFRNTTFSSPVQQCIVGSDTSTNVQEHVKEEEQKIQNTKIFNGFEPMPLARSYIVRLDDRTKIQKARRPSRVRGVNPNCMWCTNGVEDRTDRRDFVNQVDIGFLLNALSGSLSFSHTLSLTRRVLESCRFTL